MERDYYNISDYGYENFDLGEDFLQFLDEARNGKAGEIRSVSSPKVEISAERVLSQDKKSKKSWRRTLFSWLKVEKKGKDQSAQAGNKNKSYVPKKGHVSGPIYGGSGRREFDGPLLRRINSVSLAGLFSPHKRVENEVHYMCLGESGCSVENYGPVYLVT
ncbi:hypothetical protein MLD38_031083 [Melastoma candidum]|uniref:Uncharacterized protein n=1 Tax=Melastoma candidum TaxID=119954 RepID=A0ACB9MNM5_9MYRT|nr:hypothetical protein MLD38_031083 [Melastoma candidum]